MTVPRRTQRKAELADIEKRVLAVLRKEKLTTKVLSERFGLSTTTIKRIANLANIEIDKAELLTHDEMKDAIAAKNIPKYTKFPKRQKERKEEDHV